MRLIWLMLLLLSTFIGWGQSAIDLSGFTPYAPSVQDNGTGQLVGDNFTLRLTDNTWKKIAVNYTITPNTVLSFYFRADIIGEIHGVMFDTNNNFNFNVDTPRAFRVEGTQNWANADFANYSGSGWQYFTIPVGQYYTGTFTYLVLIGDIDAGGSTQDSTFQNIILYENERKVITNRRITYRVKGS